MNISKAQKIIQPITNKVKSIKWRRMTNAEFDRSLEEKQIFANCYDESVRYALLSSKKGRSTFSSRVRIQADAETDPAFKFKFNVNGNTERYIVSSEDYSYGVGCKVYDEYANNIRGNEPKTVLEDLIGLFIDGPVEHDIPTDKFRLSLGVNLAVRKMVKNHPKLKSLLSRLHWFPFPNKAFEYNKPSNAFRWYTGREPMVIGETDLNLSLKSKKDEVFSVLEDLGNKDAEEYSFVAMTGLKKAKGISAWHCLPIKRVNNRERYLSVVDKRTNEEKWFSWDDFVDSFKAIIGIDWAKKKVKGK